MTPTWAVIVVGLISGALGVLLSTLLRISHERGAEMRGRMLDAADGFSAAVVAALQDAASAESKIINDLPTDLLTATGEWLPEIQEIKMELHALVNDAQARQARVHLLFGEERPAGLSATEIVTRLRNLELAIAGWPKSVKADT
jgi:H+/Cl- antiporter ClcA